MLIHYITFAFSSNSIFTGISPQIISSLDNAIREDLQKISHLFFDMVIIFAVIVVIGVALEGPEVLHETWPSLFTCFTKGSIIRIRRFKQIIKMIGFWGWLLVIFGVSGEVIFEALQNRSEGLLQAFNEILLVDAQRKSNDAIERAANANLRAEEARKTADEFESQIASANERAANANKIAESERLVRIKLQKQLQPRRLTNLQKQQLSNLLRDEPQSITIGYCLYSPECSDYANDIGDAFKQAGWKTMFTISTSYTYGVNIGFAQGSDPRLVKHWTEKLSSMCSKIGIDYKIISFDPNDHTIGGGFEKNALYLIVSNKPESKLE